MMHLYPAMLFLGTGAADWPCEYGATVETAARGDVRGTASVLLDGRVLVDCGATVPEALELFGVSARDLTDLLITHTHGDHLDAAAVERLATVRDSEGSAALRVWVEAGSAGRVPELPGVEVHLIAVGEALAVGGISVLPVPANHSVRPGEQALHYLFEREDVAWLYATDGAWMCKETWLELRQRRLDGIVWDATNGETQGDWRIFEHNSVDMIRLMRQTLRREEVLTPDSRLILTHMARTLCAPHAEMCARLEPEGLMPAHDGMVVQLGR
jgi:phosphoribosyl 1,2-cyclic phosphodiesterase